MRGTFNHCKSSVLKTWTTSFIYLANDNHHIYSEMMSQWNVMCLPKCVYCLQNVLIDIRNGVSTII